MEAANALHADHSGLAGYLRTLPFGLGPSSLAPTSPSRLSLTTTRTHSQRGLRRLCLREDEGAFSLGFLKAFLFGSCVAHGARLAPQKGGLSFCEGEGYSCGGREGMCER